METTKYITSGKRSIDRAAVWEIIAVIVAIIGLIVQVALSVYTYNKRYDSSCNSSDGFKVSFGANSNTAASTLTASAGSVWYGAWQKSGKSNTIYQIRYKPSGVTAFGPVIRTLTFTENGKENKQGDWRLTRSKYSQKYDIQVQRMSNKSSSSVLRIDWAVDDYYAAN